MKKILISATSALLLCSLLLCSCATIVTKSVYPIAVNSAPDGAQITIRNSAGTIIYVGETPAVVQLKSAAGYMSRAEYQIEIKKDGYRTQIHTVSGSLDGWYIANILLGGLVGMLVVDPASGAMYKIKDQQIDARLAPLSTADLVVYDINNLPEGIDKADLVAIQQ